MSRIEVYPSKDRLGRGRWRYRVVGANGERMAASQPYTRRSDAKRGAQDLLNTVDEMVVSDSPVSFIVEVSR